jgi:hypothetical protein
MTFSFSFNCSVGAALKIAIGQQLSFWPFLQLNVEMAVKETNSHFGYLFSFFIEKQIVKK